VILMSQKEAQKKNRHGPVRGHAGEEETVVVERY
jgi:hypothetical protein